MLTDTLAVSRTATGAIATGRSVVAGARTAEPVQKRAASLKRAPMPLVPQSAAKADVGSKAAAIAPAAIVARRNVACLVVMPTAPFLSQRHFGTGSILVSLGPAIRGDECPTPIIMPKPPRPGQPAAAHLIVQNPRPVLD
ncbi:hypothetical protein [Sphingomonas sp.]|uniref:hypothetical protein n=1 Tax=Sphingomonas sp. TaxID=28214 RepID=UPI0035C84FF9